MVMVDMVQVTVKLQPARGLGYRKHPVGSGNCWGDDVDETRIHEDEDGGDGG